jgi:tetratricopeptide (TPR) repeat protein
VDKGRHEEAESLLEVHLAKAPGDVAVRRLLIRVYASHGALGRAREHVQALFGQLGHSSAIPWVELGHALELSHRYDEALEQYDAAAKAAPNDPLGPLTGGLRAARWGEAELAQPRLVEALRRDPRSASAWHALGLVRLKLGDAEGAKAAYSSGLTADPRALENRLGLATVAIAEGDAAGTSEVWRCPAWSRLGTASSRSAGRSRRSARQSLPSWCKPCCHHAPASPARRARE